MTEPLQVARMPNDPRASEARAPRVVFCSDTYPPQVNGVSVVTAITVAGLSARGWQCAVIAPGYPPDAPNPFGRGAPSGSVARSSRSSVGESGAISATDDTAPERDTLSLPSVALPPYPDIRLSVPDYPAVARAIRRFRPDLVHGVTEFIIGRLGQIAAARAGLPITTSYHTDFARYTEAYGARWLRHFVDGYVGRFHRRALRTYTPSAHAREDLLRLGVRDVEVWGRGVDLDDFTPAKRSRALRVAGGFDDRFTFVHVGRLAAEKNVELIIEAFRIARAAMEPATVQLVIAGAGPRERDLRAMAGADVTFLGYLDRRTRLPALYASSDAFVFASTTETLGLVVLEAMACGLPVIATPEGGVADHLRDGVNGLAFPAGDVGALASAMVTMARDHQRRRRLAAGARATAEALGWERKVVRLDVSYREVLERAEREARAPARAPLTVARGAERAPPARP